MILFYLIACISSVLGVVLVIKAVVKVRMGQAFLLLTSSPSLVEVGAESQR